MPAKQPASSIKATTTPKQVRSTPVPPQVVSNPPLSASDKETTTTPQARMRHHRTPITEDEIVTVNGRYLYVGDSSSASNNDSRRRPRRFFVQGMAFPNPPPFQKRHTGIGLDVAASADKDDDRTKKDLSGWNAVLEQLANETNINTVRMYQMDCSMDYSMFLETAAELGIYVIVPLTTVTEPGALRRDIQAPNCYSLELYEYGTTCIQRYWHHPNVLAGVVGNEVMNDLVAWQSAPCVKSYLEDLTAFSLEYYDSMNHSQANTTTTTTLLSNQRMSFPLMYATQHDSPSAELLPDEAMKLTLDYLSCATDDNQQPPNNFIFGINIESWCSSLQSFDYEEDGVTESSYHVLWNTLWGRNKTKIKMDAVTGATTMMQVPPIASPTPIAVPVIFSEMGCPKDLFNRDNAVEPKYVRDWKQVSLVVSGGPMSDLFSGFVAYGYDGGGSPKFRIMGNDDPWNGKQVLPPSPDYDNFREQLSLAVAAGEQNIPNVSNSTLDDDNNKLAKDEEKIQVDSCRKTVAKLYDVWGLNLYPLSDMPSFHDHHQHQGSSSYLLFQEESSSFSTKTTNTFSETATTADLLAFVSTTIRPSHHSIRTSSTSPSTATEPVLLLVAVTLLLLSLIFLRPRWWRRRYNDLDPPCNSSQDWNSAGTRNNSGLALLSSLSHPHQSSAKPKNYNSIQS